MEKKKKNCAFQYYDGFNIVHDQSELTLSQCKDLWNEYYDRMVRRVELDYDIEVAIWVDMTDKHSYGNTLIHLDSPELEDGILIERSINYFRKFKSDETQTKQE